MGSRRHYEDEFKDQAVRLALESDNSIPEIARDLDISPGNLRRWIRENHDRGTKSLVLSRDDAAELARLRRENKKLRAERDILKKATAFFAGESS
jgi:transposase